MKIIGPFAQILTLDGLTQKGAISDEQLEVISNGGIAVDSGIIVQTGAFDQLKSKFPDASVEEIEKPMVLLPGFVDCHTHLCFAGSRSKDYSLRIAGKSYLEIAQSGGGIWDSVTQTRVADDLKLQQLLLSRIQRHLNEGVTTIEIKSGYGLSVEEELRHLRVIRSTSQMTKADTVPTCLAAHLKPKDFESNETEYLRYLLANLLPVLLKEKLTSRVDIFIENGAFSADAALHYLNQASSMGFQLTVHADQFTVGGSEVAVKAGALSADHLEASTEAEIKILADSDTVAVVLPGASLGLGMNYAPARKLLDAGASLAIASDWNPGSAPMGDLLMQAAILGAAEKLSTAETFAGLTFRSAKALNLHDRGILKDSFIADFQAYHCDNYREILYHQGKLKPELVWKNGERIIWK